MIGDLASGYIVTPRSRPTYSAVAQVFQGRMNLQGRADGPLPARTSSEPAALSAMNRPTSARSAGADRLPVEPVEDWSVPVELMATDTSNIWSNSNSWMHPHAWRGGGFGFGS